MMFIYSFFSLMLLIFIYMRFEASYLQVERINLVDPNKQLKILQISDIHIKKLIVPIKKIKKVITEENPDVLLLTGDYIDKEKDILTFLSFLNLIKGNTTIFLCFGNHDYKAFRTNSEGFLKFMKDIENIGVTIFRNKSLLICSLLNFKIDS